MSEIITVIGVKKLQKMTILPKNWRELLSGYIETKKQAIRLHRQRGLATEYSESLLMQAIETLRIIDSDVRYGLRRVVNDMC